MEDGSKRTFMIRGRDLIEARIDEQYFYPGERYGVFTGRTMEATFKLLCRAYTTIDGVPGQDVFNEEQKAIETGLPVIDSL